MNYGATLSEQDNKAIKAGVWYTLSNTILNGISFLTIPIFARLLSTEDFGSFSNFSAWLTLLATLTTLNLSVAVARAKFDFPGKLDSYISSVQILGTAFTAICYLVVVIFQEHFTKILSLDMAYIHTIFIYLLVYPSFQLLQAKHRQLMQYKSFVCLTALSVLSSVALSLILVSVLDNQLAGRIMGYIAPLFLICLVVYFYNLIKGKPTLAFCCWKYAIPIALPLIPHVLSGNILGTSDQAIITYYCGPEQTAIYSIAYSCSLVVMMLGNSINQAWAPWLYERLNMQDYTAVRKSTKKYLLAAIVLVALLMLLSPEIVFFMGGAGYEEASSIMPPIMLGCFFWCLYTHFVNIEIFKKKTFGISVRTLIAAIANIVLNIVFIPIFGYRVAAYTTLFSYILLFVMHVFAAKKLGADQYYNLRFFCLVACASIGMMFFFLFIGQFDLVRAVFIGVVTVLLAFAAFMKRRRISKYVLKILRRK